MNISDVVAGEVVATAAVVQRHDNGEDRVGRSDDRPFRIDTDPEAADTAPRPRGRPAAPTPPTAASPRAGELARTGPVAPRGVGTVA
ncbi:hypothetical protein ACIQFZ_05650 [Streptomyces sp. NPDC093064]|uniref:hypothetical protein n=1 Tax=Streptomyces sp. NPDC093064 TaxID=3366020 RepID=UPI0037F7773D